MRLLLKSILSPKGCVDGPLNKQACICVQRKLTKTSEALARSQQQAKQADAEAEQMEKAFRVLQHEVSSLWTGLGNDMRSSDIHDSRVYAQNCRQPRHTTVTQRHNSQAVFVQILFADRQMAEMGRKMAVDASAEGKGSRASAEAQASAAADRARLEHQVGQLAGELAAAQNAATADRAALEERLAELDKQLHSARSATASAEARAEQKDKVTGCPLC